LFLSDDSATVQRHLSDLQSVSGVEARIHQGTPLSDCITLALDSLKGILLFIEFIYRRCYKPSPVVVVSVVVVVVVVVVADDTRRYDVAHHIVLCHVVRFCSLCI